MRYFLITFNVLQILSLVKINKDKIVGCGYLFDIWL